MGRKEFGDVMEMPLHKEQKVPEAFVGWGAGGAQKSATSRGMRPSQVKAVLAGEVAPGRTDAGTRGRLGGQVHLEVVLALSDDGEIR